MPRYGKIVTDHPNVTTLLPEVFLSRARAGALPRFDVVLTASSVEHSGLGRHAHTHTHTHTRPFRGAPRRPRTGPTWDLGPAPLHFPCHQITAPPPSPPPRRYNDGLNPWGDILAIARAWCVSGPHARLVIAVPTSASPSGREAFTPADAAKYKQDHIQFNGQRT